MLVGSWPPFGGTRLRSRWAGERAALARRGAGLVAQGRRAPAAYATAKAGLVGLARSLAWELGTENILVNVVAAGLTLTERVRQAGPPEILEGIAGRVPSRRLSRPADVAGLILFLASAANQNVSGEVVTEGSATGRSAHSR